MFWDEKEKKKKTNSKASSRDDFLSNIDNIKLVRKHKPAKKKKHRKPILTQLLLLFLCLELAFCGILAYKKTQSKTDVLRMFYEGKYLVLLQNNAELRPSGGFIGSFAVITFKNFQPQEISFNANIYTLDKNYVQNYNIAPPEPLAKITENRWAMRDSNFAISFPEAAEKVEWFYSQETGESVDGVIAMNASLIRDLIKRVGSVKLSDGTEINFDNFFSELNKQVEKDYYANSENWSENQPKEILAQMLPIIFKKTFAQNKIELVKFFREELLKKELQFYSNNEDTENAILAENWGGEVRDSSSDYLQINNANIAGNKSSINIEESINYDINFTSDGFLGNLTLIRSHIGNGIWPDGINQNYTQILVPYGSLLKTAELNGKDILSSVKVSEEAGKTVYGLWINTLPGASNVLNLTYNLPKNINNYQLLAQKQSGNLGDKFVVTFDKKVLFDGVLDMDKIIK